MSEYYLKEIKQIVDTLKTLGERFILGIDGAGGSGKSTFANELKEKLRNTTIICMDDFYIDNKNNSFPDSSSAIGNGFSWQRLEQEVLIPFQKGKEIKFQKFDWISRSLNDWQKIEKESNIIVEGVYSIRKELTKYYTKKIWVECPHEIRLKRGIERDGIEMKSQWENVWMKEEIAYMNVHNARSYSDFIIGGSDKEKYSDI